jgi:hypothetical protein
LLTNTTKLPGPGVFEIDWLCVSGTGGIAIAAAEASASCELVAVTVGSEVEELEETGAFAFGKFF